MTEQWRCEAHGLTTTDDCPRCDDELIALTDDHLLVNAPAEDDTTDTEEQP